MWWKTSYAGRTLRLLPVLLTWLCANALAQGGAPPLQCTFNVVVPPTVRNEGITELVGDIPLNCTGGPTSGPGSTNITLQLNTLFGNTATTGWPVLNIVFDRCTHLGQSIFCPPDVPAGSNSLYFDNAGNIVFPGTLNPYDTVPPDGIFPFDSQPAPRYATLNGNTATWLAVPVDQKSKGHRTLTFSNIQANVSVFANPVPNGNLPIFGTFTSSSSVLYPVFPTSLQTGTNSFLLGVGTPTNNSAFCESPFVVTPGVTPFAVLRDVSVGGNPYDALVTVTGPSGNPFTTLSIVTSAPSANRSCQSTSSFNSGTGAVTLQHVFFQGQDDWAQATQTGSNFTIQRYGPGNAPP